MLKCNTCKILKHAILKKYQYLLSSLKCKGEVVLSVLWGETAVVKRVRVEVVDEGTESKAITPAAG